MGYDFGDTVTDMWGEVRDATGALTAASTVALTVYLPDGTTVSPAVSNPSTGVYGADYVPAVEGPYRWWLRTTGPATAKTGSFYVNPVIEHSIVSVSDAKLHLNITQSGSDEELRQVVQAATIVVEEHLKKAVVRSTRVDYTSVMRGQPICLSWPPVLSITSIATLDGASSWTGADVAFNPMAGIVKAVDGVTAWCGDLRVTYVAGMSVIPANYREAAEIIVQHLWDTQHGSKGGVHPGDLDTPGLGFTRYGFAIPNKALELLGTSIPGIA